MTKNQGGAVRKAIHISLYVISAIVIANVIFYVVKSNASLNTIAFFNNRTTDVSEALPAKVVTTDPLAQTASVAGQKKETITVRGVIDQTNAARTGQSGIALMHSYKLDASAQSKAEDILNKQYFEHTSPDGKQVGDLVKAQGYDYIKVGENLALGSFVSNADVVTAWMNSPGHRENILDTDYTEIGIGVAYGTYKGQKVVVVVQHLGRPLSLCPTIDQTVKTQVAQKKAQLDVMATVLEQKKSDIDKGIANKVDMTADIDAYNAGVDTYQKDSDSFEAVRAAYNKQVDAFNQCVNSLK